MSVNFYLAIIYYCVHVKELTANVDLQLTEVCNIIDIKLHDEVSVRRHVGGTLQVNWKGYRCCIGNTGVCLRYTAG